MPRYGWVFNLDAELELARARPGYVARRKLLAQLAEHGASSRALLGVHDLELSEGASSLPLELRAGLRGRAWCPTPQAIASMRRLGVEPEPHPEAPLLRRVNHRRFAHEVGGGLPRQAYVRTRRELSAVLAGGEEPWLLKRPLGFAGRGQLRALGPLSDKQWTWVDASLERDGLIVEPLVKPSFEVSLHGFIGRDGQFELGRICAQAVSERGVFRGVRLAEPGELSQSEVGALTERADSVARALRAAGYFGPFGIDGYRYEVPDSTPAFCPLSEINARYTLGFVTGFPRHPSELSLG